MLQFYTRGPDHWCTSHRVKIYRMIAPDHSEGHALHFIWLHNHVITVKKSSLVVDMTPASCCFDLQGQRKRLWGVAILADFGDLFPVK